LEGGIGLLSNAVNESYFSMLGPLFTWKFALMVSILVGSVFIFRLFCRFICPLGALYGLFNKLSYFGIHVNKDKCTSCGMCHTHCKVDIKHPGDQECISCGECVDVCPTKAISWKGPKILLKPNEGAAPKKDTKRLVVRIISAVIMLAVLIGAIGYYWNQEDTTNPDPGITSAERGNAVGDLCYDYDLELVDENGGSGEYYDPTESGKITIINFWGTWCTPCVNELPYFERIAEEYSDTVDVIAIHSSVSKETAPEYIGKYYKDSALMFSWDGGEGFTGEYYTALGGRGTYPYTVILDENGIIVASFISSVEYEQLKEVVEAQLG
jgi:thiol-disulfide isomerase/thioredoxin/NAD-dependent dihydropyrimidine dehydrogenase PreA subunit